MAPILSAERSEDPSLEQHSQEVAELNGALEANVNVDELPALHHRIRLDSLARSRLHSCPPHYGVGFCFGDKTP